MHHHQHFRSSFIPKHHKCPHLVRCHCVFHFFFFFYFTAYRVLSWQRGGGCFCPGFSVHILIIGLYSICCDHVITLCHDRLKAKYDTVPTQETLYCTMIVNLKSASLVAMIFLSFTYITRRNLLHLLQRTCISWMITLRPVMNFFVRQIIRAKTKTWSVVLPYTFPLVVYM